MQLIAATVTVTTHARHQIPAYVLQDGQEVTAQKVFTSIRSCAAICISFWVCSVMQVREVHFEETGA